MDPSPTAPGPGFLQGITSEAQLAADVRWLRDFAAHIVRDPDLAEDACQEAWLGALEGTPATHERKDLAQRAWRFLFRHWRGERRRRVRELDATRESEAPSVDDLLMQHEQQQRLWAEMVNLEEPYRSTLLLRFQGELSTEEIAARTDTRQDTVRWRIREGIALMRRRLAADERRGGLAGMALFARPWRENTHPELVTSAGTVLPALSLGALVMTKKVAACLLVLVALTATVLLRSEPSAVEPQLAVVQSAPEELAPPLEQPAEEKVAVRTAIEDAPTARAIPAGKSVSRAASKLATLQLTVRALEGASLPPTMKVTVRPFTEGFEHYDDEVKVTVGTETETTEIELHADLGQWAPIFGEVTMGIVEVSAEGFGTQSTGLVSIGWNPGDDSEVTIALSPATRTPVVCVLRGSGEPVMEAKIVMDGPSKMFRPYYRSEDGKPIDLVLAGSTHADDRLYVSGKGTGLLSISRSELLALPVESGIRRIEIPAGHRLRGTVEMASGLPVPTGSEIHYTEFRRAADGSAEAYHILVHREGHVDIGEDGWFEIEGLTQGLLRLHLREEGRMRFSTNRLSYDFDVEIPQAPGTDFRVVIPEEQWRFTLDLSWAPERPFGSSELIDAQLYRPIDDLDLPYSNLPKDRALLVTSDLISAKVPGEIVLPLGVIEEGEPYILELGGRGGGGQIERQIVFEGNAPKIKLRLPKSSLLELNKPMLPTETDPEGRAASVAKAREEGAAIVLRATTPQ